MAYINRFNDYNNNAERNKQNLEDFKVRSWLPTDLVEKEMRRMKRVVDEMVVWHDAECRPNFKDMCSTCHVLKKIEGVLG